MRRAAFSSAAAGDGGEPAARRAIPTHCQKAEILQQFERQATPCGVAPVDRLPGFRQLQSPGANEAFATRGFDSVFVSIHIPKTAGTMLGYIFDFGSNRRLMWDYDDDYRNATAADPALARNKEFIESYFWGIHGHFHYLKYCSIFPDAKFITCVRHPVERAYSQFRHELYNAIQGKENWRSPMLKAGSMKFVDFVSSDDNVRLAQTVHTAGRRIEDYDFVFVHEQLIASLTGFSAKFGFTRRDPEGGMGVLPMINTNSGRLFKSDATKADFTRLSQVSKADQEAVFRIMPEEVDLYQRAKARFLRSANDSQKISA